MQLNSAFIFTVHRAIDFIAIAINLSIFIGLHDIVESPSILKNHIYMWSIEVPQLHIIKWGKSVTTLPVKMLHILYDLILLDIR